jgi:DNA polymerase-3 subunit gamma/tau
MLSKGAFNALLKIMEEPPSYLVFILATTEIQKVPETIISRCQVFTFKKIPVVDLVNHLKMICQKE